jgi:hypothetical protein
MRFRKIPIGIVIVLIAVASIGIYEISISKKTLSEPREVVENGEKHINFYDNNKRILTISMLYHQGYNNKTGEIPLRVAASHSENTVIESMDLTVKYPRRGSWIEKRGDVFLKTPDGFPFPEIHFERTENFNTRLEIPDMSPQGKGTVTLHFLLKPAWKIEDSANITVNVNTVLTENQLFGYKYHAQKQTTLKIPSD